MEPQGEQAAMELRHWDGDPSAAEDEEWPDESKWAKLLAVYASIEDEKPWKHLLHPGIRLVPGDGPETAETARVLVVGEAPGAVENGVGRPFAGPSGRVLDELLALAGLARSQCFITNVVKYRPPGNATPGLGDAIGGRKYLRAEYGIIRPVLTICVGACAHKIIHPTGVAGTEALSRMEQGALTPMRDGSYVTSFYHPAFAMRYKRAQEPLEAAWSLLGDLIAGTPSLAEALI
jgi:uracil-DNA glycosylase